MDTKLVGNRIKTAREIKRLTQEQLAEIVSLSPMHISVLERGLKAPKLETLVLIANSLNVSADYLLSDVVSSSSKTVPSAFVELINQLSPKEQWQALCQLQAYVNNQDK